MQRLFSRYSTFSERPSSMQTKCVQTFYQDRHGAKFEDKCFVRPRSKRGEKKKEKGKEKKSFPTTRDILEPYFVPCNSIYEFRCGACFNDSHDRLDLNYDTFKPLTQKFFLDLSVDYYQ